MQPLCRRLNAMHEANFAEYRREAEWHNDGCGQGQQAFECCPYSTSCDYCRRQSDQSDRQQSGWSKVIDLCLGICLVKSERYSTFVQELHRTGLCQHTILYRAQRPKTMPIPLQTQQQPMKKKLSTYGCWSSHTYCAKVGRVLGLERLLILEDDVEFVASRPRRQSQGRYYTEKVPRLVLPLDDIADQLNELDDRLNKDWHIFYLGHFPMLLLPLSPLPSRRGPPGTKHRRRHHLFRTYSVEAHAYILSRSGMECVSTELQWQRVHALADDDDTDQTHHMASTFAASPSTTTRRSAGLKWLAQSKAGIDTAFLIHTKSYAASPIGGHVLQRTVTAAPSQIEHSSFINWIHDWKNRSPNVVNVLPTLGLLFSLVVLLVVAIALVTLFVGRMKKGPPTTLKPGNGEVETGETPLLLPQVA